MEKLIKLEALQPDMSGGKDDLLLEDKLPKLLDEAIAVMPKKGRAIKLYNKRNNKPFYEVDETGIIKFWKGNYPNGDPVTRWKNLTRDEFLDWIFKQPEKTQQQVYQNLLNYIKTETPKERGEVEFPRSNYLFGY